MKPPNARGIGLALIGMVCLTAAPARALSLDTYSVDGAMLIVGNPVCGGVPCTETIAFSFLFNVADIGIGFLGSVVPGTITVNSLGPLGDFTYSGFIGNPGTQNYMPFGSPGVAEIDLHLLTNLLPYSFVPSFGNAELYSCLNQTCITDFVPPSQNNGAPAYFGVFLAGTSQVRVAYVPEGGTTLTTLALGLVGLALWQWKQRGIVLS
jgi:hypothetical protein